MVLRHVLGLMKLEEVKGALEHPADAAGRALFERNAFYRARLKKFCRKFNARELASLTPLEIDEHLAQAGAGMSDSTKHHDALAVERLQKFALEHKLLDKPVIGKLEKPPVGRRDRVPSVSEPEAILARASRAFHLIYSALRQCGARPGELRRATIADIHRAA